jgi:hypothetical protein
VGEFGGLLGTEAGRRWLRYRPTYVAAEPQAPMRAEQIAAQAA